MQQGHMRRAWSAAAAAVAAQGRCSCQEQVLVLLGLRSLWSTPSPPRHHGDPSAWSGGATRALSTRASDPGDWAATFGRIMRPDTFDAHERQLAKHFSSAKEAIGGYHKPKPWFKGGTGNRLEMFWNRLDVYLACMRSIQGFTHRRLLADASEVFRAVSYAVASQQPTVVDSVKDMLATGSLHQRLRNEARASSATGARVCWELVELSHAEVVNAAMEQTIPESVLKQRTSKLWVAQFTVRFTSKQRFWVEDRQKRVVSGDPKRVQECEDYWVFERPLYLSWFLRKPAPEGARWRLVEQLDTEAVLHPTEEQVSTANAAGMDRTLKSSLWILGPAVLAFSAFHVFFG